MPTTTSELADYLAGAASATVPDEVLTKTAWHVLDTLAAGISGSRLPAGQQAATYAAAHPAAGQATFWGHGGTGDPQTAALVNGMASHADETDDSHAPSVSHPGCGVVPAAFALADGTGIPLARLLKAVAAGYDVGPRVNLALGRGRFEGLAGCQSSHAYASLFGAVAAGVVVRGLNPAQAMTALSYGTQLTSGVSTWLRDGAHIEKAFVFAGMPARNGVFAVDIAEVGWPGVPDAFDHEPNFLAALGADPRPALLIDGLGHRYEVMQTNIKKYAVGSPAQAAVQAAEDLVATHGLSPGQIAAIEIRLPANAAYIVDDRKMPDICVQYLVAGTLLDGVFTFAMAHDEARMESPDVRRLRDVTTLVPDETTSGTRAGTVIASTRDGRSIRAHVADVRGTAQNPMTQAEVEAKAADLLEPVLGKQQALELIGRVLDPAGTDLAGLTALLARR